MTTRSSVETWPTDAHVHHRQAVTASVTMATRAQIAADLIQTGGAGVARTTDARVQSVLAPRADELSPARAVESSPHVPTGGAIDARIAAADADVASAEQAGVSLRTSAYEAPRAGEVASGAGGTRRAGARERSARPAVGAREAGPTTTRVGVGAVAAGGTVLTGKTQARRVDGDLAPAAGVPARTLARHVRGTATYTLASITQAP